VNEYFILKRDIVHATIFFVDYLSMNKKITS